jgi:outer membrane protein assembly factor BamB
MQTRTSNSRRKPILALLAVGAVTAIGLVLALDTGNNSEDAASPDSVSGAPTTLTRTAPATAPTTAAPPANATPSTTPPASTPPTAPPTAPPTTVYEGWWNPDTVGQPWGPVPGLLTFRGSPTRTFYGTGPLPTNPEVLWRFPSSGQMCSQSTTGGVTSNWCGTGWTGQPAVWEVGPETWLAFGAYDRAVHVLDPLTGERRLEDFVTGDIIKGSVTIDPDGFPLIYTGSRDGFLRILAYDREGELEEIYRLAATAVSPTRWNDDWDGAPLIIDGYLLEGGENSQFHVLELNRSFRPDGLVQVDPVLVFHTPGWDDELIRDIGDNNVSIENSVAMSGNVVYFANSGGLVQGWDLSGLADGVEPTQVFRFWMGDDVDASIVIDDEQMLYVAAEFERGTRRSREVGQLVKLDPSKPDDPLVWSIDDQQYIDGGLWATPALHEDILIAATDGGRLMAVDRATGEIRWTKNLPGPLWQSPVVVDDVLIQGDCNGALRAFALVDTMSEPEELWRVELGGCIESTPAVWQGRIYVGTRSGAFYAIGDAD